MRQGDKLLLQAQVWTTDRAQGPERAEARRPDVPGPEALRSFEELRPTSAPLHSFWENFDAKPVRPEEAGWGRDPDGAVSRGWYRFRGFEGGGDPFLEHARGLLLLDTLFWPTHARALAERPDYIAPSLDLSVWFHAPASGAEWLLLDTHTDTAGAGLIYGGGRVWSEDGRLLATGGQNMLVTPVRAS
jgi:acyl-CoA thioesterase